MNTSNNCEKEFDFTLVLSCDGEFTPDAEDALIEAGCDDATISVRSGRPFLNFSRRAASFKDAVLSAIRNIREAGVGVSVLRIDPCNLVTQAEIARRMGMTRQYVHQLVNGTRGMGGFPAPVCDVTASVPMWHWCEVAYWLRTNNMMKEADYVDAQQLAMINAVLEIHHQELTNRDLREEVLNSLGVGCG